MCKNTVQVLLRCTRVCVNQTHCLGNEILQTVGLQPYFIALPLLPYNSGGCVLPGIFRGIQAFLELEIRKHLERPGIYWDNLITKYTIITLHLV